MPKTQERHFEDAIENHLVTVAGWAQGSPRDFDRKTALVAKDFFAFVEKTQPETWSDLQKHHQGGLEASLAEQLLKALDARGTLDVLRHGFKFFGKKIECATFKPAHAMNPDLLARFRENRLVVTRVKFIPDHDDPVDLGVLPQRHPGRDRRAQEPARSRTRA